MDKYAKIKLELDKQKQYGLQLSTSLRQAQKKKACTMSSYRTIVSSSTSSFTPASLYRITHFSHFFPRSTFKKKIKVQIEDNNNEIKKLKEELDSSKKDYEKKENSYISQINIINQENEKLKQKNENLEVNIKDLKQKKNIEVEKEINKRKEIIESEKEKNKKEINKINEEMDKLKEENYLIKKENKNILNIKNELEEFKKKEKEKELLINELNMENERLKKQSALNFKLVKEENEELIKDIKKLNEVINKMKIKEKEIVEKYNKEKEEEIKKIKKIKEEREEKDKNKDEKYKKFYNLKVMRINSNTLIYKNTNPEILNKLKEAEKKINSLQKEKIKNNEANSIRNDIIHLKEIKSLKEKYDKEIKELKEENTSLNKKLVKININNSSNQISLNNDIKKIIKEITEHFNNIISNTQKKYEQKISSMKHKIKRIKNMIIKYINNENNKEEDSKIFVISELKEEIAKIEKGKQKMEVQISNYDINFKKQNNEIIKLKNELREAHLKMDKLKKEVKWNDNDKSELDDMNKKLKRQLEMYIIENNGKSKVIEERNNEISKLKELLNRKQ